MASKYESHEEVERRFGFYTKEEVQKYLKKNGVPKSRRALKTLVEVGYPKPDEETIESIGHVHFKVHP